MPKQTSHKWWQRVAIAGSVVLSGCTATDGPRSAATSEPVHVARPTEPTFTTVWESAPEAHTSLDLPTKPRLLLKRLGLNPHQIAIDVQHSFKEHIKPKKLEAKPEIMVYANGCPIDPPSYYGLIERDGPESRIVIARQNLPQGEIDLIIRAFNTETTMAFAVEGNEVRPLLGFERSERHVVPADPSKPNGEQVVEIDERPSCPATRTQSASRKVVEL